ncbi:MAG: SRPBCC family protein [Myxococcota bacterium]
MVAHPSTLFVAIAIATTLLFTVPTARADAPQAEDVKIDEIEDHTGVKGLRATFIVEHPRAVVFETINDLNSFMKLFPNIMEFKILNTDGAARDVYFKVDAVLSEAEYVLRREGKRGKHADTIVWDRLSGDARVIRGAWIMTHGPRPNTTKVVYQSYVDVAMVIPTALIRSIAIGKVKEMVVRVREGCDAQASKRLAP